jgi:hypothetical protein
MALILLFAQGKQLLPLSLRELLRYPCPPVFDDFTRCTVCSVGEFRVIQRVYHFNHERWLSPTEQQNSRAAK